MGGRALLPVLEICVIALGTFPFLLGLHSYYFLKCGRSNYSDCILIVNGTRFAKKFMEFATTLSNTKLFKSLKVGALFKFISFLKLELLSKSCLWVRFIHIKDTVHFCFAISTVASFVCIISRVHFLAAVIFLFKWTDTQLKLGKLENACVSPNIILYTLSVFDKLWDTLLLFDLIWLS
jgi:hypothetical protein